MKIPYGIADFYRIRTGGFRYVDRTDRIRTVEDLGDSLLFLRPRRFGKSLWLRTLACYYSLRQHLRDLAPIRARCSTRTSPTTRASSSGATAAH